MAAILRTPVVGAFESTYQPRHRRDVSEATGHHHRWQDDLDRLVANGVRTVRYPASWHRIEGRRGAYNWSRLDEVLEYLRSQDVHVILDLVHHTSYPEWLDDGFRDRRFHGAFVRYAEAVATRYPWIPSYTLFNEPFATLFLAGHESLWPPYDSGIAGFTRLLRSVLPAISDASRCWSDLLPHARHIWVDTCEHHTGTSGGPAEYAELANDRRHVVLDLAVHQDLDQNRPFLRKVLATGGEPLLNLAPVRVDVLGLDYYCHSEWSYDEVGGHAPPPHPLGFARLAEHYAERYRRPLMLSETNLRGLPTDRASWLRYMLEQYEIAVARGVPLEGFCWFPQVDSCDWDSLLARSAQRADPVGVESLGADGSRVRTVFTEVWESVARGAHSAELPAYRFQSPCDEQLSGFLIELAHWPWEDPPPAERVSAVEVVPAVAASGGNEEKEEESMAVRKHAQAQPDLVVLSHLRWTWVWQRPQHIVSRLAAARAAAGARTWFVEEPEAADVRTPQLRTEDRDGITRVWLVVPHDQVAPGPLGFDAPGTERYADLLPQLLESEHRPPSPDVWLYTPMALDFAAALQPGRLVYDVMDDLAAFHAAPEGLRLRQRRALSEADLVFTGGRSLHRGVSVHRKGACHLFPSGVDTAHYAQARDLRGRHDRPVAGYVGVIDERMDMALVADLAAALPDWTIRLVGPVAKIDPAAVPQAPNIDRIGLTSYAELPGVMAGFDVALMPFALNESTRSISPTKTLEYLAAGLPVVSTRVADVVADYQGVVHFADDGRGFADACLVAVAGADDNRDRRTQRMLARHEWDVIAESMSALLDAVVRAGVPAASTTTTQATA